MPPEDAVRRQMEARFSQLRRAAADLLKATERWPSPAEIPGPSMSRMRRLAAEVGQYFHEFNAARNAMEAVAERQAETPTGSPTARG